MTTITYMNTLEVTCCGVCAIDFAMPVEKLTNHRGDGTPFWCPNGHRLVFFETREMKLQKDLAATEKRLESARCATQAWQDQAEQAERRRVAQVGANTKLKKRISNGVCPCCKRSFADLHRHMAGQHPDFAAPAGGA